MNSDKKKAVVWPFTVSVVFSILAILISFLTPYYTVLKPFDPIIRIDPKMGLQHKVRLGLYINIDLLNNSPRSGLITEACVILYNVQSPEDRYLLEFLSFRVLDEKKVAYGLSEEELPLIIEPRQRTNKTIAFYYANEQPFPISMGTYVGELMLWSDNGRKTSYSKEFSFQISKDILDEYVKFRDSGRYMVQEIYAIGYTPLESKKLTKGEYRVLK